MNRQNSTYPSLLESPNMDHSKCLFFSLGSYPTFPLQVVTNTSIVTKGNISYTGHVATVTEDDLEYTYIAVPQPSLCKLTFYRGKSYTIL